MKTTLRLCVALMCICVFISIDLFAENPPYAKTANHGTSGGDVFFRIRLDTTGKGDCDFFAFDCNTNNLGIQNTDIYWYLIYRGDCSGCITDSLVVDSGVINHGFWGSTAVVGSTASGTNCANPGGADEILTFAGDAFCPGSQYDLMTYAFNSDSRFGVPTDMTSGQGPWACCVDDPSIGNLQGMEDCTLPANGGTGTGWFNPSYPQYYSMTWPGQVNAPTLDVTANITDGETVQCGFDLSASMNAYPDAACNNKGYQYRILFDGIELLAGSTMCTDSLLNIDLAAELLSCTIDPMCLLSGDQLMADCGDHTLTWEAWHDCANPEIGTYELDFTLACPDADTLTIGSQNAFICPGDSVTVEVQTPANLNIPYINGTYELHWNNPNPYTDPNLNYLGSGTSVTLYNDGTFPINQPISITGSVWETFSTSAPEFCEALTIFSEVVMLSPLDMQNNLGACDYSTISVSASGGLPDYDATQSYTFDATSAGAGTNTTGLFTQQTDGSPIAEGTYQIYVSDGTTCIDSIEVQVYEEMTLMLTPPECDGFTNFSLQISGGQLGHPDFNDYSGANIMTNLDGFVGHPNPDGSFVYTGDLVVGMHTLTVNYLHTNIDGSPSGIFCSQTVEFVVSELPTLTETPDLCQEVITVTATGGTPDWTFYLYTDVGTFDAADPENAANGWLSTDAGNGSGTDSQGVFMNAGAGNYTVYALDSANCPVNPINVELMEGMTLADSTDLCDYGTLMFLADNGLAPYIYTLVNDNGVSIESNTSGEFFQLPIDIYTVIVEDANGCTKTFGDYTVDAAPLSLVQPLTCSQVMVNGGVGPYLYELITPSPIMVVASNNTGVFDVPDGDYLLSITDANGCDIISFVNCQIPCTLMASDSTYCVGLDAYMVAITIEGDSTYTISDGINPDLTEVSAGQTILGPYPNGGYNITVSSEYAANCMQTFTGTLDCFNCDLAVTATTACENVDGYNVVLNIAGSGTYSIDNGTTILTGILSGELTVNGFLNGSYSITVTSEIDTTCTQTVTGEADCFECELVVTPSTVCVDDFSFNAIVNIVGNGTYTIVGNNDTYTGVSSGDFVLSDLPNGDYNFLIYSEIDSANCSETFIISEDCFACDLNLTTTTECIDDDTFNAILSITGDGTFTLTDGTSALIGLTAGETTIGPLANGQYTYILYSDVDSLACNETFTVSEDCFNCDLEITTITECIDDDTFNLLVTIVGDSTFTITDGTSALIGLTAGTTTIGPLNNGTYNYTVYSEIDSADCNQTISVTEDCFECDLEVSTATECIDGQNFNALITITGDGTFTLTNGTSALTGLTAGTTTVGPLLNGDYSYTIYSEIDSANCSQVISISEECFECALSATASPVCVDINSFNVVVSFAGNGEYSVSDGITTLDNQAPGSYTFGPYNNDDLYQIIIASETDTACIDTLSGTANCFECDLNATATPVCLDVENYEVTISITGSGTFTIDNGIDTPLTGQVAGNVTLGNYPNNFPYTIIITSETDTTCNQTLTGVNDCFDCTLTSSIVTECIDLETFNAILNFSGLGTYDILADGVLLPNQTASDSLVFGPYNNGDTYSIEIISTVDTTCTATLSGTENCFECDLNVTLENECMGFEEFQVLVNLVGSGTFTINDGINAPLTGQTAGQIAIGPYPNNTSYIIVVTSEIDSTCTQILMGTHDCFDCNLNANAITDCVDFSGFNLLFEFTGNGPFTISDGVHPDITGATSGSFNLGNFENGNYTIVLTSEIDPTCQEIVTGALNCFECDLSALATPNCLDDDNYEVIVALGGSGTFTISDGINPILTNQTAGNISIGPFPNGSYSIIIASETDPDCLTTLSGSNDCTPDIPCDQSIVAAAECLTDSTYNVIINFTATESYTIDDGINPPLTGQTSGQITVGPFSNGGYSIVFTNEADSTCSQTISGSNDCTPDIECEVTLSAVTECLTDSTYQVLLTLTGEGIFTVTDGVNPILTGQTAGTIPLGPLPNGIYNIIVINEADPTCLLSLSGTEDCTPEFECDLEVAGVPFCIEETPDIFGFTLTITGTSTYTVEFTDNPPLTGVSAGVYELFMPEGGYFVTVTSEEDATCALTLAGSHICDFDIPCDQTVSVQENCISLNTFEVILNVQGTGTFTIDDGVHPPLVGQTAGNITLGPFSNGAYSINIIDEADPTCIVTIGGTQTCDFDCALVVQSNVVCLVPGSDAYEIHLTIMGSGLYSINDGINPLMTNLPAGNYTIGPYTDLVYSVFVQNQLDPFCFQNVEGVKDCTPNLSCDMDLALETSCDGIQVVLSLTITGSSTYIIQNGFLGEGGTMTGLSAGTYTFNADDNSFYNLYVTDENDPDCTTNIVGNRNCFGGDGCDLQTDIDIICLDNGAYNLIIDIEGTDTYNMTVFVGGDVEEQQFFGISPGIYEFGPINNNYYNVSVNGGGGCFQDFDEFTGCAPAIQCELEVSTDIECVNTTDYNVILTIEGNSTYFVSYGESVTEQTITGLSPGVHEIGPFDNDYFIIIQDENPENFSCQEVLNGSWDCEECDYTASTEILCDAENSQFSVVLTIEGDELYTVTNPFGEPLVDLPSGEHIFGPFFEDFTFNAIVLESGNTDCQYVVSAFSNCVPVTGDTCTLNAAIQPVCSQDGTTYTMEVTILGTDTYTISDGISPDLTGQSAGTYSLGPYPNGVYSIRVTNEADTNCFQNFGGSHFCFPPPICDLDVALDLACLTDSTGYQFDLELGGTGMYDVTVNGALIYTGLTASMTEIGTFIIGPFSNNEPYLILVTDQLNGECSDVLSGVFSCQTTIVCDLTATASVNCVEPETGTYELSLTLGGTSTYTIVDGITGNTLATNATAGTVALGLFTVSAYELTIIDNALANCSMSLFGTVNCSVATPCELAVDVDINCLNPNTYEIVLNIQGPNTYNIYDGLFEDNPDNGDLLVGDVTAGIITIEMGNGGYELVIIDQTDDDCYVDLIGGTNCFFDCEIDASVTPVCLDNGQYNLVIALDGSNIYDITVAQGEDGPEVGTIEDAEPGNTFEIGPIPNGSYWVEIQDVDTPPCDQFFSGIWECEPTDTIPCTFTSTVTASCLASGGYSLVVIIEGDGTYTANLLGDGSPALLTGVPAGAYVLGPFFFDQYTLLISHEQIANCEQGIVGAPNCDILPPCTLNTTLDFACNDFETYNVIVSITGSGTYALTSSFGNLAGLPAGDYTFNNIGVGNYNVVITSEQNPECFQTLAGSELCEDAGCVLNVVATSTCVSDNSYEVVLTITGTDTYIISDGVHPDLTGQTAGVINLGIFTNPNFSISVTSETNQDCNQTIAGLKNCFVPPVCDLTVTQQSVCVDETGYNVLLEINGTAVYSIDDGTSVLSGQVAGMIELGPFQNGFYTISVTDESNADCFQTVSGVKDCAISLPCDLSVSSDVNCLNEDAYEIRLTLTGSSLYTISDGINPDLTGQAAGVVTLPSYVSGIAYNIVVTDEANPDCFQSLSGIQDCNETNPCNLSINAVPNCVSLTEYEVVLTVNGTGTYTISDGINPNLLGQTAGTFTLGGFTSEQAFNITVADEDNVTCVQSVSGIQDCSEPFSCSVALLGEPQETCLNETEMTVTFTFSGQGTYTIEDGQNLPLINVPAGELSLNLIEGAYQITITSEIDPTCTFQFGGTHDCQNCDVGVTAEAVCIDPGNYNLVVTVTGTGTYTVSDGINAPLTGVTAGILTLGPYPNGDFNITVTDETIANCTQTTTGKSGGVDCSIFFPCDLIASASTSCIGTGLYSLTVTLAGSSLYTIDEGDGFPLINQTAGVISLGAFPNGPYNIVITDEFIEDCSQVLSGSVDCTIGNCDLSVEAETLCIDDEEDTYAIQVTLSGSSTYTISDGVNPNLTGQTAGVITLNGIPNGNYTITVIDEENPTCSQSVSGSEDCTPVLVCDLSVETQTQCISEEAYAIQVTLSGSSTYTISDGVNPNLTGQTAGIITLNGIPNGDYTVTVIDEANPICSQVASGTEDCRPILTCDVAATTEPYCLDNGEFRVTVSLSGTGVYSLADGFNAPLTGQTAGIIDMGPIPNGDYTIIISDESLDDCSITLTGEQICESILGSIGNLIFNDSNQDGIQQINESGIEGVSVNLINDDTNQLVGIAITDENGMYLFEGLPAGNYLIFVQIPTDFLVSPQDVGGDDELDSDINSTGISSVVTLGAGDNVMNLDAGLFEDECGVFNATLAETCVGNQYTLTLALNGGTGPYFIDGGTIFTGEVTQDDLPLPPFGPIASGAFYTFVVTDANGCNEAFFGTVTCGTVAVELLDFSGEVLEAGNLLKWTTATEINNDYFTLYRSTDGIHFEAINHQNGSGNTSIAQQYNFLDTHAPNGISYYRLDQTDFDGTTTSAGIISLTRTVQGFELLNMLPIPARDFVQLQFHSPEAKSLQLQVFDVAGRILKREMVDASKGVNLHTIDVSQYASGVYVVVLGDGETYVSGKLIRE